MTLERLCMNCEAYFNIDDGGGECRLYPPTIQWVGFSEGADQDDEEETDYSCVFPRVHSVDHCMQFIPKDSAGEPDGPKES